MIVPDSRFWLKLQGWMMLVCAIFTLVLGVIVWFETLETRAELGTVWGQQTTAMQSLLQQRVRKSPKSKIQTICTGFLPCV
jgi:uncharacterized membrane protein HdeD (DUF308 family)